MDHQRFESWLFSGESLTVEQERRLHLHLAACASCRALEDAWQRVERQLLTAGQVAPAPGFVNRWQARLAAERAQAERRQSLLVLTLASVGTTVLLAILVVQLILAFDSPAQFLLAATARFTSLFSQFNVTLEFLLAFGKALPGVFLFAGWVAIASLGMMSALWIVSLLQFTFQRRIIR